MLLANCARLPGAAIADSDERKAGNDFDLIFLAGPSIAEFDNPVWPAGESTCEGNLVVARVKRMPLDDRILVGREIHELAPDGTLMGSWRVPIESVPMSVDGESLTVITSLGVEMRSTVLVIGRDGRISSAVGFKNVPVPFLNCPGAPPPVSGYPECASLEDTTTHLRRTFTLPETCR
jgi:hypothetical protein